MGVSKGADCVRPVLRVDGRNEGAMSPDGRIIGSYVHGIFADNAFRAAFLDDLAKNRNKTSAFGNLDFASNVDTVLDDLAEHIGANLDMDGLARIAGL